MLLRILRSKLNELRWIETSPTGVRTRSEENLRSDLDDFPRRLRNLQDRHRYAVQEFSQAVEHLGGFQVQLLDLVVQEMNPAPRDVQTEDEEHAWLDETFRRVAAGIHVIENAAAGRPLDARSREVLEHYEQKLKPAAERVCADLRLRVATAPPPPAPRPGYGRRLHDWVLSPGYALFGGPCLGAALVGVASGTLAGLGAFLVVAVAIALVPPFVAHAPAMTYTRASVTFGVLTAVVTAGVMVGFGYGLGLLVFLLLTVVFMLGQHVPAG